MSSPAPAAAAPAATQQPKMMSHSAQAGTTLARLSTSRHLLGVVHAVPSQSSTAPVRERTGAGEGPRNCHRYRLRWDNAATAFPKD